MNLTWTLLHTAWREGLGDGGSGWGRESRLMRRSLLIRLQCRVPSLILQGHGHSQGRFCIKVRGVNH